MTTETQLKEMLLRLTPDNQKLFTSVRKALQKRFPSLNELVYDYGRAIVIAWSPNERGSDAVLSIDVSEKGVRLVFTQGVKLPDPQKVLQGKAGQVRFIMLESPKDLVRSEVATLMAAAEKLSTAPLTSSAKGSLILKDSRRKKG